MKNLTNNYRYSYRYRYSNRYCSTRFNSHAKNFIKSSG